MAPVLRRTLSWIVVLAIAGAGVFFFLRWRKANASSGPTYKTARIERGTIAAKVTATGTLSARTTVLVGSQVSGRIADILVDFNSMVKKGDVLARIDQRLFKAAVEKARAAAAQANASVIKAKANAAQAKRALDRSKKLNEQGLAGQAEIDAAEALVATTGADIMVAQAQVASAAASLSEAEVNLGFTTILSPIDGIVLSRAIDVGQTVAASLSSPTLFTIAQDLRSIQVDTYVAEADVGKLVQGMEATFTVDAFPGRRFVGKVREVRNAAQTVQNVVTYDAVLDVQNDKLELKPGMTANVTFIYQQREDVLTVPNAALRFKPSAEMLAAVSANASASASAAPSGAPSGSGSGKHKKGGGGGGGGGKWAGKKGLDASPKRTLWLLKDGKPQQVTVEIGLTDGTTTELVSGLAEGDEVITDAISAEAPKAGAPLGQAPAGGGGGGGGRRAF
ncbi:MAG: efflux RND transporter periplasmic adaptor subunit [Myxococcales bacterium]|nr:efflux RND transporter periplasmic adaptor subunit [Myxococcales bacterium]